MKQKRTTKNSGHRQWSQYGEHEFMPVGEVTKKLPPGVYFAVQPDFSPPYIHGIEPPTDKPILVDDGHAKFVFDSIQKFWDSKAKYESFNLIFKRGILMYGPPGSGKTVACQLLAREVVSRGGYVLITTPNDNIGTSRWALSVIREIHPEAPLVHVLEDIDKHEMDYRLLSLLDGERQLTNIVNLATTNYLGDLDERLVNRPSRFDEVIEVAAPSAKARESYIRSVLPEGFGCPDATIRSLVAASDGLMMAHMRELVISTQVFGQPIDAVAKRLLDMATPKNAKKLDASQHPILGALIAIARQAGNAADPSALPPVDLKSAN